MSLAWSAPDRELEQRAQRYALALVDGDEIVDETDGDYVRPFFPLLRWWLRGRGLGMVRHLGRWVIRHAPRWEFIDPECYAAVVNGRRCYVTRYEYNEAGWETISWETIVWNHHKAITRTSATLAMAKLRAVQIARALP